jgi:hypothetical protein
MNYNIKIFLTKTHSLRRNPPTPHPRMLTDECMHSALSAFMATHSGLPLARGPVRFENEGVFTSVQRMRTLMPMTWHGKYPNAAMLELRGPWCYPVMMMNDNQYVEPDPPVIIVRDALDRVVVRLKPTSVEEVHRMLEHDVFDLPNIQSRLDEGRRAAERKAHEVELKAAAVRRRMALDAELRAAVVTAVDTFEAELQALVGNIVAHLNTQQFPTDADAAVPALHAFEGGVAGGHAAVVKEVKARVERALVQNQVRQMACQ